jgi:signal transduction histidine kinase
MNDLDLLITGIVATLTLGVLVIGVILLIVTTMNRRNRMRAQMAELKLLRDREVMQAEREAIRSTLRDVGRELHDNVGQLLTVAQLGVNTMLETPQPDERLEATREALEQGIDEVRRLGRDLNTDLWEERSLVEAIQAECSRLERVGRMRVEVVVKNNPPMLPAETKTILFRIFQEIIANSLKHGGADRMEIIVHGGENIRLVISDNGRGFDPAAVRKSAGLVNIHRRSELIGYEARCTTAQGKGCTWVIEPRDHGT